VTEIAEWIQESANDMWVCSDMAENMAIYYTELSEEFDDSATNIIQGFLSNMLANIISINNIFNSLAEHSDDGNSTGVIYDTGRFIRILVDFEPVETGALTWKEI